MDELRNLSVIQLKEKLSLIVDDEETINILAGETWITIKYQYLSSEFVWWTKWSKSLESRNFPHVVK